MDGRNGLGGQINWTEGTDAIEQTSQILAYFGRYASLQRDGRSGESKKIIKSRRISSIYVRIARMFVYQRTTDGRTDGLSADRAEFAP